MEIFIQGKEVFFSEWGSDEQIRLHSEQLVVDVIDIMLKKELYTMPVFYNTRQIGVIQFKDLISFITHKEYGESLIYHKLNYNLESVLVMLAQKTEPTCLV
ncbi:hypothetical protein CPT03_04390 [Pedobacter ginsengisoli]|uniref:CBS domain-containing protein n=1 Tax=Pedobacter ginsengisoli TaxID=363852 RepID=A0A2D1U2B5_9SPHI|nr:hypothetical protein [Pedobacter ginsengisoli]ATP55760.1 hypothetical protein CPT03_04390 [Pedobacter ginsengisoli]